MRKYRKSLILISFLSLIFAFPCIPAAAQEGKGEPAKSEEHGEGDKYAVWKWANFAILAAGLGFLLMKNLPPALAARTREIQKGIAEAQQVKADAEKRAAEMEARMKALGKEIDALRAQSQAEMQKENDRIRKETEAALRKVQEQSALEIEAAGKTARRDLKRYASRLALDLAEQRIRAKVDASIEGTLVENFVSDLGRREANN